MVGKGCVLPKYCPGGIGVYELETSPGGYEV